MCFCGDDDSDFEELCTCCCLCCCNSYNPADYKKKKEFFCYCYQAQRKSYWCNKFFTNETQEQLIPFLILYFLLELMTIAFEQQYERYKGEHQHIKTFYSVFLGSFIMFLYFSITAGRFINYLKEDYFHGTKKELLGRLSEKLLDGTYGIVLFNGIFSLIFSSIYLFNKSQPKNYIFQNNVNIILLPILMNKLYYLTLNYYCTYTSEKSKKEKFELFISSSTLISLYMLIWDGILFFIKEFISYFQTDDNFLRSLYIFQFIASIIPCIIFAVIFVSFLVAACDCCNLLCCNCKEYDKGIGFFLFLYMILSFIFCFGGCWLDSESIMYSNCCCCDKKSKCYCNCWKIIDDKIWGKEKKKEIYDD